jgi:predicted alpha/beta-hydrolase family hydrolase
VDGRLARRLASLGDVVTSTIRMRGAEDARQAAGAIAAHRAAVADARAAGPLFLVGKSMGGRVGCHVALEETVAGVVCLGYPLQSEATVRCATRC